MNEYSNPAQAEFMNTYVPIPFEQLYKLGAQAKADVETSAAQLGSAVSKWSEFKSPSQKDTQAWYNATIGRAKPIIEEMSNNMDLMKSAEGRAKINSIINNVDAAKLSALRQSAESLGERRKIDQQLMLSGKYNPDWHKVDYAGYDTTTQGVFSDTTPIAYKSVLELASPYYKDLQPHLISHGTRYDKYGITKEDVQGVANRSFNDIYNTPEGQMHMRTLMSKNPGMTPEQAKTALYNEVVQSHAAMVSSKDVVNEYGLAAYKQSLSTQAQLAVAREKAALKAQSTPGGATPLTDKLAIEGLDHYQKVAGQTTATPEQMNKINSYASQINAAKSKGDVITANMLTTQAENYINGIKRQHTQSVLTPIYQRYAGTPASTQIRGGRVVPTYTVDQQYHGTKAVIDRLTHPISAEGVSAIKTGYITGKPMGTNGNEYEVNTRNLVLPQALVGQIIGLGKTSDTFKRMFETGTVKGARMELTNEAVTTGGKEYLKVKVHIPHWGLPAIHDKDLPISNKIDDESVGVYSGASPQSVNAFKLFKQRYKPDTRVVKSETGISYTTRPDSATGEMVTTTKQTEKDARRSNYVDYTIDALLPIPNEGSVAETINNTYNKKTISSAYAKQNALGVEAGAYDEDSLW